MPSKPLLEVLPEVLNGVEVWRLCWPWYELDLVTFELFLGLFAGVLGVTVRRCQGEFCQND